MRSTNSLPPIIAKIPTTQDNNEVLPSSGDLILLTTSQMTSTHGLSLDKSYLPRRKTGRTTTEALTARGVPPL